MQVSFGDSGEATSECSGKESSLHSVSRINKRVALAFLFLASLFLLIAYLPDLPSPLFSVDDADLFSIPQVQSPGSLNSLKAIFRFDSNIDYYPIRDLSYLVDSILWGQSLVYARIHQMIIFCLGGVFAYLALLELGVSIGLACFSICLWMIHPYHAETLMWLSARKDVYSLTLCLISFYLFLTGSKSHSSLKLFGSCFFFATSLLSKASFSLLPFVGVLGIFLDINLLKPKRVRVTLFVMVMMSIVSCLGQGWFYSEVNKMNGILPLEFRIKSAAIALGRGLMGWVWPEVNIISHDHFGEWIHINSRFIPIGGVIIGLYFFGCLTALRWGNRRHWLTLGLLAALYVPISGIVFPHRNFYSSRYFEPLSLAIFMAGVFYLSRSFQNRSFPKPASLTLILFPILAGSTLQEAQVWEDGLRIREKASRSEPSSISQKGYLLGEVINSEEHPTDERYMRNQQLKVALTEDLEKQCTNVTEIPDSFDSTLLNCHVYLRHMYFLNRGKDNGNKANRYLELFLKVAGASKPPQQSATRIQLENMLFTAEVPDLRMVKNWQQSTPYYLDPTYRSLRLITDCLMLPAESESKDHSKVDPKIQMETYFNDRLLTYFLLTTYLHKNLHPRTLDKVNSCLGLHVASRNL